MTPSAAATVSKADSSSGPANPLSIASMIARPSGRRYDEGGRDRLADRVNSASTAAVDPPASTGWTRVRADRADHHEGCHCSGPFDCPLAWVPDAFGLGDAAATRAHVSARREPIWAVDLELLAQTGITSSPSSRAAQHGPKAARHGTGRAGADITGIGTEVQGPVRSRPVDEPTVSGVWAVNSSAMARAPRPAHGRSRAGTPLPRPDCDGAETPDHTRPTIAWSARPARSARTARGTASHPLRVRCGQKMLVREEPSPWYADNSAISVCADRTVPHERGTPSSGRAASVNPSTAGPEPALQSTTGSRHRRRSSGIALHRQRNRRRDVLPNHGYTGPVLPRRASAPPARPDRCCSTAKSSAILTGRWS